MSDPVSGETVGIAVRLNPGVAEDAESLGGWRRARLRREAVPERWFIVEEILVPCGARSTATPFGVALLEIARAMALSTGKPILLQTERFELRSMRPIDASDRWVGPA